MGYLARMDEYHRLVNMTEEMFLDQVQAAVNQVRVARGNEPVAGLTSLNEALGNDVVFTPAYVVAERDEDLVPFCSAWDAEIKPIYFDGKRRPAVVLPVALTMFVSRRKYGNNLH